MKHFLRFSIPIFLMAAFSAAVLAQRYADHTPRDGDRLHPGLAASPSLILSVNDSTKTVLIDPQVVSLDNSYDASPYIDGDTISYVQFATKHRFLLRGDTLSYIGYENRATDFRLDAPVSMAVFPLRDGSSVYGEWTGCMLHYGSMILRHVRGTSRACVQEGWTLTDGADTVRNATRLTWTLDMAYVDPDSVTASMPDSVASKRISEMQVDVKSMLSERLLTERTIWFSEDARYPVLTGSRISRVILGDGAVSADTVPLSMLAVHYPAAHQHYDTGEHPTAQEPDEKDSGIIYGEYAYESPDTGAFLTVGEPEVIGETLTITLGSLSGSATATVMLFTYSGIRLTDPVTVAVGTVPQTYTMEIPAGWTGVLLLRVESGEESYTRTMII